MNPLVKSEGPVESTELIALRLSSGTWTNSILIGLAFIIGGLVAIGVAWSGVAATPVAAKQVAFIVSGGLSGLALVIVGAVVITVQVSRYLAARELQKLETSIVMAEELLELVEETPSRTTS